ncbi:hypothetical protein QJQ45_006547 [Haematococcus lacustris]|nr:hypothetical protein QJQ45_006547 [Haematococcus lacustris]
MSQQNAPGKKQEEQAPYSSQGAAAGLYARDGDASGLLTWSGKPSSSASSHPAMFQPADTLRLAEAPATSLQHQPQPLQQRKPLATSSQRTHHRGGTAAAEPYQLRRPLTQKQAIQQPQSQAHAHLHAPPTTLNHRTSLSAHPSRTTSRSEPVVPVVTHPTLPHTQAEQQGSEPSTPVAMGVQRTLPHPPVHQQASWLPLHLTVPPGTAPPPAQPTPCHPPSKSQLQPAPLHAAGSMNPQLGVSTQAAKPLPPISTLDPAAYLQPSSLTTSSPPLMHMAVTPPAAVPPPAPAAAPPVAAPGLGVTITPARATTMISGFSTTPPPARTQQQQAANTSSSWLTGALPPSLPPPPLKLQQEQQISSNGWLLPLPARLQQQWQLSRPESTQPAFDHTQAPTHHLGQWGAVNQLAVQQAPQQGLPPGKAAPGQGASTGAAAMLPPSSPVQNILRLAFGDAGLERQLGPGPQAGRPGPGCGVGGALAASGLQALLQARILEGAASGSGQGVQEAAAERAIRASEGASAMKATGGRAAQLGAIEEDEAVRRDARRRHRKRVARVVADQWLWFARERLQALAARRHHHRRLAAAALVAWQAALVAGRMGWRTATVHANKQAYLLLAAALQAWHLAALRLADLRQRQQQLADAHARRLKAGLLHSWQAWCAAKARGRKQALQAAFFLSFITLSRGLAALRAAAARGRWQRSQQRAAQQHWADRLQRRALRGWVLWAAERRANRSRLAGGQAWHRSTRLLGVLMAWRAQCNTALLARRQAALLLLAADRRWLRLALAQALRVWLALARHRRHLAAGHASLASHHTALLARSCLTGWSAAALRCRQLRLAAGALGPVGRRWRLVLAWDALGWAVQVSQGQRGEELRQRVLLKATFRLVGSGAVDPGESRTAAQGFHAPQDPHAALRVADLALTLWVSVTSVAGRGLLSLSDGAGAMATAAFLHLYRQAPKYLHLLCCGMAAMHAAVQARAAKLQRWGRCAAHHQRHVLAAALHTWAHTFLPMAAEARARAAWGASHWRHRLLRVALEGWMTEAARLAVQRGWEAEADAFAAASRLDRSFEAWALALRLQRSHRARKAAALAAARQQLAKKQTTRLLAGWREVTVHWLLKSLQAARAAGMWRERIERRVWSAWRVRVQETHARSLLAARSAQHWATHCLRVALPAWMRYVAHRRCKHDAVHLAIQHKSRVLLSQGLAALSWYCGQRRLKADNMRAAAALHLKSLQREGVQALLHVGLARRQQRLAVLASNKAQAMAAELALVEPYARRWRRLAQASSAHRSRCASLSPFWAAPSHPHTPTLPVTQPWPQPWSPSRSHQAQWQHSGGTHPWQAPDHAGLVGPPAAPLPAWLRGPVAGLAAGLPMAPGPGMAAQPRNVPFLPKPASAPWQPSMPQQPPGTFPHPPARLASSWLETRVDEMTPAVGGQRQQQQQQVEDPKLQTVVQTPREGSDALPVEAHAVAVQVHDAVLDNGPVYNSATTNDLPNSAHGVVTGSSILQATDLRASKRDALAEFQLSSMLRMTCNPEDALSDLHLASLIGSGGFAAVFAGLWHGSGDVAVKICATNQTQNGRLPGSAITEAILSKGLSHPSLIHTFDVRCCIITRQFLDKVFPAKANIAEGSSQPVNPPAEARAQTGHASASPAGIASRSAAPPPPPMLAPMAAHTRQAPNAPTLPFAIPEDPRELHRSLTPLTVAQAQAQQAQQSQDSASFGSIDEFGSLLDGHNGPALTWAEILELLHVQADQVLTVLVMQRAKLGTLWEAIQRGLFEPKPDLPPSEARKRKRACIRTVCEIASKPGNCLLNESRSDARGFSTALSDFGLASLTSLGPDASEGPGGTAPCKGGIMLYEMVTSSQAYKGLRYAQVINMVLVQQIRPPWPAHAMPDLGKLYLRCVAQLPQDRPTASELTRELRRMERQLQREVRNERRMMNSTANSEDVEAATRAQPAQP